MNNCQLRTLIPPPINPQEQPSERQWAEVESRWCSLPSDYRSFINAYGSGCIDDFIWIFNPSAANEYINFSSQVKKQLEVLKEVNATECELQLVLYPEPAGWLPVGITDNGDLIAWETIGTPDEWVVGVLPARSSPVLRFELNITSFLYNLLARNITCQAFPSDFPGTTPRFNSTV